MKFKFLILLAIVLIIPIFAHANDQSIEGVGGSLKVLNGENPSIQMVSEIVTMDIYPTYYDVKASFVFLNHGDSVTVKMGFPESGHGDIDLDKIISKTSFINFSTYVDGKLTPASRMKVATNEDEEEYQTYWVKEVSFNAKQQRKVDVIYRSKVGDIAMPGIFAEYNFTGGNWYGKVKESQFVATLHLPSSYEIYFGGEYGATFYGSKDTKIDLIPNGDKLFFSQKNWQAEGYLEILIKKPTSWELANPISLSQNSINLLTRIKGLWVSEDYINLLETTKSPFQAMKQFNGRSYYLISTINGKYTWSGENNQCIRRFGDYIRDFISIPAEKTYNLVSGRDSDREELSFGIDFDSPEVTEITSLTDCKDFYKAKDLETVANEMVLAGKYQDKNGEFYSFSADEVAHWPKQTFNYNLNIKPFCDFDWFVNNNNDNEKSPDYYAFEFKDNLLYLYKASDTESQRDIKLKKEPQPFLILRPIKNTLPQISKNILTPEYAKFFNEYPGGEDLPQIKRIINISKANSLSQEGFSLYKVKNDTLAIKKYEEALKYYASSEIYLRYGNSLSNIPRLEDAIKAYQIATELNYDKSYLVYYNIACAYSRMQNSKEAFSYLELAINKGYQNFDHIQKDDDLAFLRSQPEWKDWLAKHLKN